MSASVYKQDSAWVFPSHSGLYGNTSNNVRCRFGINHTHFQLALWATLHKVQYVLVSEGDNRQCWRSCNVPPTPPHTIWRRLIAAKKFKQEDKEHFCSLIQRQHVSTCTRAFEAINRQRPSGQNSSCLTPDTYVGLDVYHIIIILVGNCLQVPTSRSNQNWSFHLTWVSTISFHLATYVKLACC